LKELGHKKGADGTFYMDMATLMKVFNFITINLYHDYYKQSGKIIQWDRKKYPAKNMVKSF